MELLLVRCSKAIAAKVALGFQPEQPEELSPLCSLGIINSPEVGLKRASAQKGNLVLWYVLKSPSVSKLRAGALRDI